MSLATSTLAAPQPVQLHRRTTPAAPHEQGPWTVDAIQALLDKPLMDLLFEAQTVHRQHWPAGDIELATLLSVKTGGCPENCGYCPQAAEFDTGVTASKLMEVDEVVRAARPQKTWSHARLHGRAGVRQRPGHERARPDRAVKDWGGRPAPRGHADHTGACLKRRVAIQPTPRYSADIPDVVTRAYQDRLTPAALRGSGAACLRRHRGHGEARCTARAECATGP